MNAEPRPEHGWLQQLVGEWTSDAECIMGPDQPSFHVRGTERVRSIGGLWTMGEGRSVMPDGEPATTIMSLGFDPNRRRFVGTFIGSMMTHLWIYDGTLDATGKILTLDAEGPAFPPAKGMARYQDVVEMRTPDHRILSSRVLRPDGEWQQFMTVHYRRAG